MKRILIAAFVVTAILLNGCAPQEESQLENETSQKLEPVRIITLDYQTIKRSVEYTSSLIAFEEIHMAPAAPGRIKSIPVEIGNRMAKGDLLVQMDPTQLVQAEVQLQTLEKDFQRLDTLRKVGSIPQQQFDQMKAQLDIARANVSFLKDNTRLYAPFSGVISGKYFESGEIYSGAPNPLIGKSAIVSLVQINKLKTIVAVSEKYFPQLKAGTDVVIHVGIFPDKSFTGKVIRIHPVIDPASRTFNVEIVLDNSDELLRPGMFSRVAFDLEEIEALVLPAQAVLKLQGSNDRYLFIEENGLAKRISVRTGDRYDDMVEVISDELKPGQRVVISGQARLIEGMQLQILN